MGIQGYHVKGDGTMNVLNTNDLEAINDLAEDVITSLRFIRYLYNENGKDISREISIEEMLGRIKKQIDNSKYDYLDFENNEELRKIPYRDSFEIPFQKIKDIYLNDTIKLARILMRTNPRLDYFARVSDDVPDEFLDDMLALRWRENLKLWLLYFALNEKTEK